MRDFFIPDDGELIYIDAQTRADLLARIVCRQTGLPMLLSIPCAEVWLL